MAQPQSEVVKLRALIWILSELDLREEDLLLVFEIHKDLSKAFDYVFVCRLTQQFLSPAWAQELRILIARAF